jgi:hypothetical protein
MAIAGSLKDMSLVDIIQFICRNKEKSRVSVENKGDRGILYLAEGQIVHAESGQETGEEALYQLLKWEEGRFHIEKEVSAPARSIEQPWTAVLMQAMQRIDEEGERPPPRQGAEANGILKELADRVPGFVAGYTTDLKGRTFSAESSPANATFGSDAAPEALFQVLDVVNRALEAVEAGRLKETITLTKKYRFIIRYVEEGEMCLQLVLTADGNLGCISPPTSCSSEGTQDVSSPV